MPRRNVSRQPVFPQYTGIERQLIYEHNDNEPDSIAEEKRITGILNAIARLGLSTTSTISDAQSRLKEFNFVFKGPKLKKQFHTTPQDIEWLKTCIYDAKNPTHP